jgi:aryl sulfotransferase
LDTSYRKAFNFYNEENNEPLFMLSPYLENRGNPLEDILFRLEKQTHRRFIKSHLKFDYLPYKKTVKYIYVGRDGRDVAMSLWTHYKNFNKDRILLLNKLPGRVGDEFPECPEDIHVFFKNWISRGWREDEPDGYPYQSFFQTVQSWWNKRHLRNILLIHYNDLSNNLEKEISRIANFLSINLSEDKLRCIVDDCKFEKMKKKHLLYTGLGSDFFHEGTNKRWLSTLRGSDLDSYVSASKKYLSTECRNWIDR